MNRARSTTETSVGLFAFLDVLMSTMGSLILVLMVVTPKIHQESLAKAAAEAKRAAQTAPAAPVPPPEQTPPPPPVEVVDLNAPLEREVVELSRQTEARRRTANSKRAASTDADQKLAQAKTTLDGLKRRVAAVRTTEQRAAQIAAALSAQGIEVESRIANTGERLRTIRGQIAKASSNYTFVAYDGVSGTTRRPVLIECTKDHIRFLQENISLSSADITGFTPAYNPLLAGAQALIDYWSTHSAPGEPTPYLLIVVRPSGTFAYYRVRQLLERLRDPFGYELLDDQRKLDVPPPVPEAVAACRKAIEKSLAEREGVFQQVFGNGPGGPAAGSGLIAGGSGPLAKGGQASSIFDDVVGGPSSDAIQGSGQPTGTDPKANGPSTTGSATTGQPGPTGTNGLAGGIDPKGGSQLPNGAGTQALAQSGNMPGPGGPAPLGESTGTGARNGNGALNANGGLTDTSGPNGSPHGPGIGGNDQGGKGRTPKGDAGPPALGIASPGSPAPGSSGIASVSRDASPVGLFGSPGVESPVLSAANQAGVASTSAGLNTPESFGQSSTSTKTGTAAQAGSPSGGPPGAPEGSIDRSGVNPASANPDGPNQSGTTLPGLNPLGGKQPASGQSASGQMAQDGPMQLNPGGESQPGETHSPSSADSGGQSSPGMVHDALGAGADGGSADGGAADGGLADSSPGADGQATPNPGRSSQRRFGLSSPQATVGFERDVTIRIESQQILVGGQPPIFHGEDETSGQLAAAVIAALDRDVRTWGRPPKSFYWVPHINFVICPGGNLPYEQIRRALMRRALIASVDYRLDDSRSEPPLGLPPISARRLVPSHAQ